MMIPATVHSFQDLARWLIDTKHAGQPYGMAKTLKISAGLPYQWRDGLVKSPQPDTLARMCDAYALEWDEVVRLCFRPPVRRRRGAAVLVAALSLFGSATLGPSSAQAQHVVEYGGTSYNIVRLIGSRRRRLPTYWACCPVAGQPVGA